MSRGGWRPGSGRKPGQVNERTKKERAIATKGVQQALKRHRTPLEVILARMNGDGRITDASFQAAIAAAPYIHPRLASSDTTIKSDNTHRVVADEPMTPEQWTAQYVTPANDAVSAPPEEDDELKSA